MENEYAVTEPNLTMELESETACAEVMDKEAMKRFLHSIYAVHNGVYAMSQDIPGLVETSSNLASIKQRDGKIVVVTSQRSSILSSRKDMSQMVRSASFWVELTWKPETVIRAGNRILLPKS